MRSADAGGGIEVATIEIAGRRLDFATGDLTGGGRTVRLTPKVCDILRVLAAQAGSTRPAFLEVPAPSRRQSWEKP